jgi:hypothetical protein
MSSHDEDAAEEPPLPRLPPPFIYTPSLANLRDVGGLSVPREKMVVRRGILYRAADPTFVTEGELAFLNGELGITHIYDLRSEPEFERQGDALIEWEARIKSFNEAGGKVFDSSSPSSSHLEIVWTCRGANFYFFFFNSVDPKTLDTRFQNRRLQSRIHRPPLPRLWLRRLSSRLHTRIHRNSSPRWTLVQHHPPSPRFP